MVLSTNVVNDNNVVHFDPLKSTPFICCVITMAGPVIRIEFNCIQLLYYRPTLGSFKFISLVLFVSSFFYLDRRGSLFSGKY